MDLLLTLPTHTLGSAVGGGGGGGGGGGCLTEVGTATARHEGAGAGV